MPFKFNFSLIENVDVTDQHNSGRCWIFAGLNVLRHKLIEKFHLDPSFELSQSFIYRWDKFEKCNAAIELIYDFIKQGKGNNSLEYASLIPGILGDGGTWNMFVNVVKKYGVVPKDIYPDNHQTRNSTMMNNMLEITVQKTSDAIKPTMSRDEFNAYKKGILDECYKIINLCMGNVPESFVWSFDQLKKEQTYTPKTFHDKVIKPLVDLNKFVSICHFPIESYNQVLVIEYLHNVIEKGDNLKRKQSSSYLNIDINMFKEAIFRCIKKNTAVWFACDISHYWLCKGSVLDQNASNLKDMFDVDFSLSKRAGLESRTNVPNHAMTFVGCQKDDEGYKRWKVENSHGDESGKKGFITMSDAWFNEYVICAAVPIDCLPIRLRMLIKEKKHMKYLPFYSVLGTFAQ